MCVRAGRPACWCRWWRWRLLVIWVGTPPGLPSGPIVGKSRVVDGDTLDVGNRRIRLAGIDAPERAQECLDADGTVLAVRRSSRRTLLADLVGQEPGSPACRSNSIATAASSPPASMPARTSAR